MTQVRQLVQAELFMTCHHANVLKVRLELNHYLCVATLKKHIQRPWLASHNAMTELRSIFHLLKSQVLLQELQLKVSYVDHKAWNGKDPDEYPWSDSDNEDDCIHRASTCYAECIFPVLQDIEQLCVRPLLQSEFEILLQHLPKYPRLRWSPRIPLAVVVQSVSMAC